MDSILVLFLRHCGFQKCITFASNKKFAWNCTRHHTIMSPAKLLKPLWMSASLINDDVGEKPKPFSRTFASARDNTHLFKINTESEDKEPFSGSKTLSLLSLIDRSNDKFVETIEAYLITRSLQNDKSFIVKTVYKG